jgi:hypothetical protein
MMAFPWRENGHPTDLQKMESLSALVIESVFETLGSANSVTRVEDLPFHLAPNWRSIYLEDFLASDPMADNPTLRRPRPLFQEGLAGTIPSGHVREKQAGRIESWKWHIKDGDNKKYYLITGTKISGRITIERRLD